MGASGRLRTVIAGEGPVMVRVPLFTIVLKSSPLAWGHERALVKLRAHACGGGGLRALKGALVSQAAAERRMQVLASHLDQLCV